MQLNVTEQTGQKERDRETEKDLYPASRKTIDYFSLKCNAKMQIKLWTLNM
jgi:hypothetical protein